MNKRKISNVLSGKFEHWVKSIKDEKLQDMVRLNTIITGGAIYSLFVNEPPNDYDIYFRTPEVAAAVAEYYIGKLPKGKETPNVSVSICDGDVNVKIESAGIVKSEGTTVDDDGIQEQVYHKVKGVAGNTTSYDVAVITSNAISLTNKIQLITRFCGEPDEIHKNFDYVHATNYWTSWEGFVTLHKAALESMITKELKYVGSLYPLSSIIRMRKFINRGWRINAGQIVKICYQLSLLDLNDLTVLEEQLIGVDYSYFADILDTLKESGKMSETYLSSLIDEVF